MISRSYAEQVQAGTAARLSTPSNLALHTMAEEEDDTRTSSQLLSWRRWLTSNGPRD